MLPKSSATIDAHAAELLRAAFDVVLVADAAFRIVDVAGDTTRLLGRSAEDLLGIDAGELMPPRVLDTHARLAARMRTSGIAVQRLGGGMVRFEIRHAGGALVPVEAVLVDLGGQPPHAAILLRDATGAARMANALAHATRVDRVLGAVHGALAGADDERSAYFEVCRILVAECGYPLAWVGLAQCDARRGIRVVARAGHDAGYLDALELSWSDEPAGRDPTGTAIHTGETVVVPRFRAEPGAAAWVDAVHARRYAGGAAIPLRLDGAVVGALAVYARGTDAFVAREIDLLEEIAARLSRAITLIQARRARLQAEARLGTVLDDLGVVAWSVREPERRLTYLNAAGIAFLGRPHGEIIEARDWLRAVHPEDRRLIEGAGAATLDVDVLTLPFRIQRPDGSTRWVHGVVRTVRDADGAVVGRDGIGIDVTAQHEAEVALARREQFFRRLVEGGWDLIGVTDAAGRVLYAAGAWERVLGVTAAAVLGSRGENIGFSPAAVDILLQGLLASGTGSVHTSVEVRRLDGQSVWLEVLGQSLLDDPAVSGIVWNGRDITERKLQEAALRALNTNLERLVAARTVELQDLYDNAPCGYHTVDPEGAILRVNGTELRWLGRTREEVVGHKLVEFLSEASAEGARTDLAGISASRAPAARWGAVEREFVHKDGSTFVVLANAAIVRDAEGRFLQGRTTLVDITERKRAERLLREQDELIRDALDHARDLVAVSDASHRITYVRLSTTYHRRFPDCRPPRAV